MHLLGQLAQGVVVAYGAFDVLGNDHGLRLSFEFARAHNLGVEVVEHHLGLGLDSVRFALNHLAQQFLCAGLVVFRVLVGVLHHLVETVVGGVVCDHIEDETLLYGLAHRVEVERAERAVGLLYAEAFEGLALGRGGKGEK